MKKHLLFTFLLSIILTLGISYAQTVKKPTLKNISTKRVNLKLRSYYLSGTVFEINCNDGYIKLYSNSCKVYKVGIKPSVCNSLKLSAYDTVKVTYFKGLNSNPSQITAKKVRKIRRFYLKAKIKVINCIDGYIDMTYKVCNRTIDVRVGVPYEECIKYDIKHNDTVKVYGKISYSERDRRFLIRNTRNIVKQ